MFEYHHSNPLILSSLCPQTSSLVTCAFRIGGIIDPEFLIQCQIIDKKLEKEINQLKQIPIKYDLPSSIFHYQEELFLDMDLPNQKQFCNSLDFKQHNSWLINHDQWNIIYTFNDDLII